MRDARYVRAAAKAARRLWATAQCRDTDEAAQCPIDDVALRQFVRAYGLSLIKDTRLPHEVLGKYDPKRLKIKVNSTLQPPDLAFVIAHELGHHCLGHDADISPDDSRATLNQEPNAADLDSSGSGTVFRVYSRRERQELEANLFAAELIVPSEAVALIVAEDDEWSVKSLASRFGMRETAIEARLATVLLDWNWDSSTSEGKTDSGKITPKKPCILDEDQKKAVSSGAAIVLAGPGSGKTRVLVERYVRLIEQNEAKPTEILALTFTNKAAAEMRERVLAALAQRGLLNDYGDSKGGIRESDVQITTLHAFALDLVTRFVAEKGRRPPALLTETDALLFLASRRDRLPLGAFEDLSDPYGALSDILDAISLLRERDCTPLGLLRLSREECFSGERNPGTRLARWKGDERMQRWRSLAIIYWRYLRFCREGNYLDFTGILHEAALLILRQGGAEPPRLHWRHVLVDEYQDMNLPCARLLRALARGKDTVVWAVGDPRQSIYRFRGATPEENLTAFRRDYPEADPLALAINYRSVPDIVALGHSIGQGINLPEELRADTALMDALNRSGLDRDRDTGEVPGAQVTYGILPTEADELNFIGDVAERLHLEGNLSLSSMAVLCRTKRQATAVATMLEKRGLPTTWAGALEDTLGFRELICALLLSCNDTVGFEGISQRFGLGPEDTATVRALSVSRVENGGQPLGPLAALRIALAGGSTNTTGSLLSPEGIVIAEAITRLADGLSHAAFTSGVGGPNSANGAWRVLAAYLFNICSEARDLLRHRLRHIKGHDSEPLSPSEAGRLTAWTQTVSLARSFPSRAAATILATHSDGSSRNPVDAFLDYIQVSLKHSRLDVSDEVPTPNKTAINVLTIHGSKGLEWPVVFVPNLSKSRFKIHRTRKLKLPTAIEPDETREDQCVFYVAVTRARDRVFLTRSIRYGASSNRHNPAACVAAIEAILPPPSDTVPPLR